MRTQNSGLLDTLVRCLRAFLPPDSTVISLKDFKVMEEQGADSKVYSFILAYVSKGVNQRKEFVLKLYRERYQRELSLKEFVILEALKERSFPVPETYYLDTGNTIVGTNFIVMERIPGKIAQSFLTDEAKAKVLVDKMAEILSRLHKLDPNCIPGSSVLQEQYDLGQRKLMKVEILTKKTPMCFFRGCSFRQQRFVAAVKRLEELELKKFRPAILNMDYTPSHFFVSNGRFAIVDWADALVGDPAFDVATAYHYLRIGKEREKLDLGEHFVNSYAKYAGEKLTNIQLCKDRVILKLALWSDLSPFRPSLESNVLLFAKLARLTLRRLFEKRASAFAVHQQILQRARMRNHHNIALQNIDSVQNYIIAYLEKNRYSAI